MTTETTEIQPGNRVRITQQLPQVNQAWSTTVEGTVLRARQAATGSWFAHSRGDRLWLDRLEVRRDDGEIVVLNLDQYTQVQRLDA